MDWFKKHADTVMIIGSILSSVLWMNSRFNDMEKDITIIKTVLVMKNIMPSELCVKNSEK